MPVIDFSTYEKPRLLFNRHIETIVPAVFRKVSVESSFQEVTLKTRDQDIIEVDWYQKGKKSAVILSHGLEGNSRKPYILGMARHFLKDEWDVVAWNYRGCGEKLNSKLQFYHSGATYDLEEIVNWTLDKGYERIALIGFSLGGNLTLKYLGEQERPKQIVASVVFSVPLDLAGCSREIEKPHNFIYAQRFLRSLKKKVIAKMRVMPDLKNHIKFQKIDSVYTFDDRVTAPLHGFDSADHYYQVNSSAQFVDGITIPTLVVNAANDPFLSKSCLDRSIFDRSEQVNFEMPKFGGHVGFSQQSKAGIFWSEARALEFISQLN